MSIDFVVTSLIVVVAPAPASCSRWRPASRADPPDATSIAPRRAGIPIGSMSSRRPEGAWFRPTLAHTYGTSASEGVSDQVFAASHVFK